MLLHAGRHLYLLADEPNIREIIMFPFNQTAQDLMMGAPAPAATKHLKELSLKIDLSKKKAAVKEESDSRKDAGLD